MGFMECKKRLADSGDCDLAVSSVTAARRTAEIMLIVEIREFGVWMAGPWLNIISHSC